MGVMSEHLLVLPGEVVPFEIHSTTPVEGDYHYTFLVLYYTNIMDSAFIHVITTPTGPGPPPPSTGFMEGIVAYLVFARDWLIAAFNIVSDWIWPLYLLANPLDWLQYAFSYLAFHFSNFAVWVNAIGDAFADILNWASIQSLIRSWLTDIEDAVSWFSNWWLEVRANINNWWSGTMSTVQGWIDLATQPFNSMLTAWTDFWNNLWPDLVNSVDGVWYAWSNFWNNIYPSLVSFSWLTTWWNSRVADVQGLIDTAFTLRDSLWAGWQEVRDQVVEFFTDPWGWLYDRFTDWFLGEE